MKNYDRYQKYSEKKYNKKTISNFFMKERADKVLLPYIKKFKGKTILEVGLGYGYYTRYLIENQNTVTGYDINPELGQNIGIEIICGCANQLLEKVDEKYDCVMSFFMTEYLDYVEMSDFISQSIKLLQPGGVLATTVIVNKGLGWLYTVLARMKGIRKYNYSKKNIKDMIDTRVSRVSMVPLNTILGIPFAILLEIEK